MYLKHKIGLPRTQCIDFLKEKIRINNFKQKGGTKHLLLHSVHADFCGQFQVTLLGGGKYLMLITEATKRVTQAIILKNRNSTKVTDIILDFMKYLENFCCMKIKVHKMLTDNTQEFRSNALRGKLQDLGIREQYRIPHTAQSSRLVEHMNSVVLSKIRTFILIAISWSKCRAIGLGCYISV
jgi:hypothetical protein